MFELYKCITIAVEFYTNTYLLRLSLLYIFLQKSPKWMDEGETFLKIQRTRLCYDNSKKVVLERGELKIRTRPDKADVWNP